MNSDLGRSSDRRSVDPMRKPWWYWSSVSVLVAFGPLGFALLEGLIERSAWFGLFLVPGVVSLSALWIHHRDKPPRGEIPGAHRDSPRPRT